MFIFESIMCKFSFSLVEQDGAQTRLPGRWWKGSWCKHCRLGEVRDLRPQESDNPEEEKGVSQQDEKR